MSGHHPFKRADKRLVGGSAAGPSKSARQAFLTNIQDAELAELRKALKVSQQELATLLGKSQGAVAQLEQRTDMKISTPHQTIEAFGGHLQLIAEFPTGDRRLSKLGQEVNEESASNSPG